MRDDSHIDSATADVSMETEQKDLHKEFVGLLKERFEMRIPFRLGFIG